MEIKKILLPFPLYRARNAEHYGLYSDIIEAIPAELAEKYQLTPLHSVCVNVFGIENDCHLRNQGYKNTEAIEAEDKKRDDLLLALAQTVEAYTRLPIAEKAEAAKRLNFLLKPYRDAYRLPLAQETANIRDFILKMKEEENATDIETLGLTEMVTLLDEANKSFNALYKGRSGEILVRSTSDTMKTIRPKVDAAFSQLFDAVNGLYIVNELTTKDATKRQELGKVIDDINSLLIQLQKTLIRAGVIGGKTEDKDTPEPTPEPVKPEITEVYSKVEDPHDATGITRGKETIMKWVGDFELVNETGDGPGKIIVKDNFTGVEEEVPAEDILSRSNTGCEFIMIRDFAEGDYKIRIETYVDGSLLKLEYGKIIKLV